MLPDTLEVLDNEALRETLYTHTTSLLSEEMTHCAVPGRNLTRNACLSGGLLLKVRGGYFRCLLLWQRLQLLCCSAWGLCWNASWSCQLLTADAHFLGDHRPGGWKGWETKKKKKQKWDTQKWGSEVEIWISGQDPRIGRGQRPVNQGFLVTLSLRGLHPLPSFTVCLLTAGPAPSDPRRFVSRTKILRLWFLIKSIFNLGPVDICSRKVNMAHSKLPDSAGLLPRSPWFRSKVKEMSRSGCMCGHK